MTWKGLPFSLFRKQARALIYVLGVTLEPVSRDSLVFLFWPDSPETTARRNLSRVLSYIRKSLPHAEILQINMESITLNPQLVWSDAAHFKDLAEQNSPENQEAMVALYDGSLLSGFDLPHTPEFDSWLTVQQGVYEGQYLAALKTLIHNKISEQDYESAIDFAHKYLDIDDVAEDVHQALIRIYAASGDRGAAMRQFEACTLILERELGVEPLPETRMIYETTMSEKASTQLVFSTKPTWAVLPSLDLPLIGRQAAWDSLDGAYHNLQDGGVILISGEPGIGKSRLLKEFATSKDRLVLTGNCHASTQALPYQPVVQALRQALAFPDLWKDIQPIWLTETSRLMPELSEHFSDLPPLVDVEPD
jgi:DNA-binding SARP family transcriptional activator